MNSMVHYVTVNDLDDQYIHDLCFDLIVYL